MSCTVLNYEHCGVFSGAHVSNVSPDYGSLGGETRITITGGGKN